MPELPEVETVRALLDSALKGETIRKVHVFYDGLIKGDVARFKELSSGATIASVKRKGKMLRIVLSNGASIYSHLRMEGRYYIGAPGDRSRKHDRCEFDFASGKALYYNDSRKFGRMEMVAEGEVSPFDSLGPEPFAMEPSLLVAKLQGKSISIKSALLDQSIVSGIGNIYADETLFAARISPLEKAKDITLEQAKDILEECSRIMNTAIEEGGSTIRSYHPSEGVDGLMQLQLQVYDKPNFPCPRCFFPLHKIFLSGRGTTYCPICQKLDSRPFVLGITGPIHVGKSTASRYFAGKGYSLFDADECVKSLYLRKDVKKQIIHLFGRKSYQNGKPDFAYIRGIAIDKKKKEALEKILHPLVREEAKRLIASKKGDGKVLLDVPLLFPSNMDGLCDATILIDAPIEMREKRLLEEGKDAKALLRLNKSYPLSLARGKATFRINNSGSMAEFLSKLEELPL